jgi:hypothetical protein
MVGAPGRQGLYFGAPGAGALGAGAEPEPEGLCKVTTV